MKPWIRNSFLAGGVLVMIAGLTHYWFVVESEAPSEAQFALDIGQIRRLADIQAGDKPVAVEAQTVAMFKFPAATVVAGDDWQLTDLPVFSYRIVYPGTSVIIDTALDQQDGGSSVSSFDPAAFGRMQAAMARASLILITHEHVDHIGGLTSYPNLAAILPAMKLTREQLADPSLMLPARFADHALDGYVPLSYDHYAAVAPGIVLIKSPGHSPGSQMVHVRTANGTEFLFLGDVAWHFRNVEAQRERPRLVTQFMLKEDRKAVFGELAALKRLHQAEPNLHMVPGHDGAVVDQLVSAGLIKPQFAVP